MSSNEDKKGWGILIAVFLLIALLWGYHARRNGMKEAAESSASDTSLTEIIASADSVSAMTDSERKSRKKRKRKKGARRRKSSRTVSDDTPYRDILSDTIPLSDPGNDKQ